MKIYLFEYQIITPSKKCFVDQTLHWHFERIITQFQFSAVLYQKVETS